MRHSEDRRHSKRARSLLNGRIIFNDRNSVLECTIRDISDTGARIAFAHPIDLPPKFELDIPKKGSSVCVKVMWSYGNEYGVLFLNGLAAHTAGTSLPDEKDTCSSAGPKIEAILYETRRRIADLAGISVDAVKLNLRIEGISTS